MRHERRTDGETGGFAHALALLARERLTAKQKRIVAYLHAQEDTDIPSCATHSVREIGKELRCSYSTVWNCLASLKNAGLVERAGSSRHRAPLALSDAGACVARSLAPQEDHAHAGQGMKKNGGRRRWERKGQRR